MTKDRYTNAAELGRLAGISRERVGQVLARGDFGTRGAVRVVIGERTAWRIKVRAANRWLRARGLTPPEWVKRVDAVGAMDDVWVSAGSRP